MTKKGNINIIGNRNSNIGVGQNIMIHTSTQIEQASKEAISENVENWRQVLVQLSEIQKSLQEIPEQHEVIRDEELIPAISKTKSEVKKIIENPSSDKTDFLDKLKKFCDVSGKVVEIGAKVAPFFKIIGGLIGIPL